MTCLYRACHLVYTVLINMKHSEKQYSFPHLKKYNFSLGENISSKEGYTYTITRQEYQQCRWQHSSVCLTSLRSSIEKRTLIKGTSYLKVYPPNNCLHFIHLLKWTNLIIDEFPNLPNGSCRVRRKTFESS